MENNKLTVKYGLATAIAMVVGIVIGSGVFFKAEKILLATGGNLPLGILAWIIGGAIMVVCAYAFSIMATKYSFVSGVVDYAEVSCGKKYGYMLGWFLATIYYPALTGVLAWVSARYLCVIIGFDIVGPQCMIISMFFLVAAFTMNALSPLLAGKFQVSTTIIKLIPLALMAVVGTIVGLNNGMTIQNFTTVVTPVSTGNALFTAVVATSFAYEGWIIATTINAELKDSKKNLPLALVFGTLIVATVYICYYIGLAGGVSNEIMMAGGETGAKLAFQAVFSNVGAGALFIIIVISCLGTLNGLMMGCTRGFYALAARGEGPAPKMFKHIDPTSNMPTNSSIMGLFFAAFWLMYFYGANLTVPWFGPFCFDTSELPIVTLYAAYIPIFWHITKDRALSFGKRFIAPVLAICGCIFMVVAACFAHGWAVAYYIVVFVIISLIGAIYMTSSSKTPS
ncbi:MAG: APC family permease [Candidatus Fimivivens sp.]